MKLSKLVCSLSMVVSVFAFSSYANALTIGGSSMPRPAPENSLRGQSFIVTPTAPLESNSYIQGRITDNLAGTTLPGPNQWSADSSAYAGGLLYGTNPYGDGGRYENDFGAVVPVGVNYYGWTSPSGGSPQGTDSLSVGFYGFGGGYLLPLERDGSISSRLSGYPEYLSDSSAWVASDYVAPLYSSIFYGDGQGGEYGRVNGYTVGDRNYLNGAIPGLNTGYNFDFDLAPVETISGNGVLQAPLSLVPDYSTSFSGLTVTPYYQPSYPTVSSSFYDQPSGRLP